MAFRFTRQRIPDVIVVAPSVHDDERGSFFETYRHSEFTTLGIPQTFVQDNHSVSQRHVLRGLHYQKPPAAQGKLVRVVAGEIFDVVVDIRRRSPYFGQWVGVHLSSRNRQMLYAPPGFAHGFCVVSPGAEVIYKTTAEYTPELERGIVWNDPDLKIPWPAIDPRLSPRDQSLPRFRDAKHDFD